ncbi:hypothetical protein BKA58DRAFT_107352 [Alternaria rosae]|uniref:uncharacterized protein n=1 Tax=Alternaria rosae TaxID=1187941 RepID=UPI001E8D08A2|nr:uncharacterized protein BKA58DRAFT_107352 [Alternaria rosae]KAH6878976.1 hypothetical protein BKA58DRAFT_107352 [Alternaria rosae]
MAAVAQSHVQDDVHPLLRHPRPIKRDSAKAQRMLGLIADSEEALRNLQREKSVTTRWLERPMYEHLGVSDVEEEKDEPREVIKEQKTEVVIEEVVIEDKPIEEKPKEDSDSDLLDKWTNPNRPASSFNPEETLSKLPETEPSTKFNTSPVKRRPLPLTRPTSYNAQHLLSPEWIASPATMSPNTPGQRPVSSYLDSPDKSRSSISSRGSCECERPQVNSTQWTYPPMNDANGSQNQRPISYHPQSFTALDSPPMQSRPRPTSFATYHQRNRSGTKIASSRGLRNNSYPQNHSRPVSGCAPKAVAGENIENDMVYQQYGDDEVGPPTPVTSSRLAFSPPPVFAATPATPIHSTLDAFATSEEKNKPEKKIKHRWSTIPQALKNFGARRRDSSAQHEQPKFATVVEDLRRMNLTQENLQVYEAEANQDPAASKRLSAVDLIPTPTYSPFDMNVKSAQLEAPLPAPFAPWADAPPSPAASAERRRSSGNSLSPTTLPSQLSNENLRQVRPVSMQSQGRPVSWQSQARPVSMQSQRSSIVALPSPNITCTAPQPYQRPAFDASLSPRAMTPSSRRNTPAIERTCILCKTSRPVFDFSERRITTNCWHEPATCVGCLQAWVRQCAGMHGLDRCTCPECGELMAREDGGLG